VINLCAKCVISNFTLSEHRQADVTNLGNGVVWSNEGHSFAPRKSKLKFRLQVDRPYTSFYRHYVVTLALDCFVSDISLVCITNATFVRSTYPLVFHPKFGDVPLELDRGAV